MTPVDFEQRARAAADGLRSTPVPTPAVAGVLRRGRRRSTTRAAGLTVVTLAALVLGGLLVVRVTPPAHQGTAATAGPLAGSWTIDVPTDTAARAQVPAGAWTVTVVPGSITLEPVGRPADRIVEHISAVGAGGTVQVLGEDQSLAFNFVCATSATYSWTATAGELRLAPVAPEDTCLARRLVLTLPWAKAGPA